MPFTPNVLPELIAAAAAIINAHADEVTELDQAIGDGDHVVNLQRGLQALSAQSADIAQLDWPAALQKIGMALMSTVGGASGSLYGTLFVTMSKAAQGKTLDAAAFADVLVQGIASMKLRGKSDVGEKTMLDVLCPVAESLRQSAAAHAGLAELLTVAAATAVKGMEATRDMLASKGRASFLGERSLGHIDAGAKTAQLMICAMTEKLIAAIGDS